MATVVSASYGRCLAYYKPPSPVEWGGYTTFCQDPSLTGGIGVGNVGKFLGSDYLNIKAAWNGQHGVDQDAYLGLAAGVCGWGSGCPVWYNNGICPNYITLPWDLTDGYDETNAICNPSMLPANFSAARWQDFTLFLNAVVCEFGKNILIILTDRYPRKFQ